MPEIALVVPGDTDPTPYVDAIVASGGQTACHSRGGALSKSTTGLLLAGESDAPTCPAVADAILGSVERGLPVLGIGWGMRAINEAYGGDPPAPVQGEGTRPDGGPERHRIFLAPGAKLSYTIGGSGWVTMKYARRSAVSEAQLAPALLASAFAEDRVVEAVELPGRQWVIGVQWPAHLADELPSGFDNVLLAFIERAGF